MKIVSARRFGLWTKLAQRWAKRQYARIVAAIADAIDSAEERIFGKVEEAEASVIAAIPAECSSADIDHMFEAVAEDGSVIVPSNAIGQDGTMPIGVFTALTGLTPTE